MRKVGHLVEEKFSSAMEAGQRMPQGKEGSVLICCRGRAKDV
jgi:hypothetical protein